MVYLSGRTATETIYSDALLTNDTRFKPATIAQALSLLPPPSQLQSLPRKRNLCLTRNQFTDYFRTTTVEAQVTADAVLSTVTSITTVFTETVPSSTTTLTPGGQQAAKRDVAASPPKCMTNGVTYPASRITSACSCIDVPAATVSITQTVSTEIVTEVSAFAAPRAILHLEQIS